jgi:hypothetical protein
MIPGREENSKAKGKKSKFRWREIEASRQGIKEKMHRNVMSLGEAAKSREMLCAVIY